MSLINTYLKDLKVSKELLREAEKEGSAREFFFRLVELLSGGKLTRREIKKIPYEEQERLILELVRENSLEDFFSPKEAKNIYSALRKAFRRKEQEEIELEWEGKIANCDTLFEALIQKAAVS